MSTGTAVNHSCRVLLPSLLPALSRTTLHSYQLITCILYSFIFVKLSVSPLLLTFLFASFGFQPFSFQRLSLTKPVLQLLPNSGGSRDLVLGMAMNINLSFLSPFVLSLRRFSSAKVVLFVDDGMSEQHRALLVEVSLSGSMFAQLSSD